MGVTLRRWVEKPVTGTDRILPTINNTISHNVCRYLETFQAVDLTVQLMEMGEKAAIQTDAKYAYGTLGR